MQSTAEIQAKIIQAIQSGETVANVTVEDVPKELGELVAYDKPLYPDVYKPLFVELQNLRQTIIDHANELKQVRKTPQQPVITHNICPKCAQPEKKHESERIERETILWKDGVRYVIKHRGRIVIK